MWCNTSALTVAHYHLNTLDASMKSVSCTSKETSNTEKLISLRDREYRNWQLLAYRARGLLLCVEVALYWPVILWSMLEYFDSGVYLIEAIIYVLHLHFIIADFNVGVDANLMNSRVQMEVWQCKELNIHVIFSQSTGYSLLYCLKGYL